MAAEWSRAVGPAAAAQSASTSAPLRRPSSAAAAAAAAAGAPRSPSDSPSGGDADGGSDSGGDGGAGRGGAGRVRAVLSRDQVVAIFRAGQPVPAGAGGGMRGAAGVVQARARGQISAMARVYNVSPPAAAAGAAGADARSLDGDAVKLGLARPESDDGAGCGSRPGRARTRLAAAACPQRRRMSAMAPHVRNGAACPMDRDSRRPPVLRLAGAVRVAQGRPVLRPMAACGRLESRDG